MKSKVPGGEFLGCRRINGQVFIYQDGVKFRVKKDGVELVLDG